MTYLTSNNGKICFTKNDLRSNFSVTTGALAASNTTTSSVPISLRASVMQNKPIPSSTLDSRIQRALNQGKLLQLKKGLYTESTNYHNEPNKAKLSEYLASQIYQPSYISLEYVLEKHDLLPRTGTTQSESLAKSSTVSASEPITSITPITSVASITSITTKPTQTFKNFSGTYRYTNIKSSLYINENIYTGLEEHTFHDNTYHIATKAKAMFDYLYLNSTLDRRNTKHLRHQLFDESGIQWENFSEEDFKKFDRYVWNSKSKKMMRVLSVINEHFENKKFDAWKKEFLS